MSGEATPTADDWRAAQDIFLKARDLPRNEVAALLDDACRDEPKLREEIESLLEHDPGDDSPFLRPPPPPAERSTQPDEAARFAHRAIGDYHVKQLLASGGMGTVYLASGGQPHRTVALKVMKRRIASPSAVRRFEFKTVILGRLHHPAIGEIYDAGVHEEDGERLPYFAMEYIPRARSITEYASEERLGTRERMGLFARVCEGVHHGHQKGIIHRDLKPGNILIDTDGRPKVIDFGVARATDSDLFTTDDQTSVGQLIGTLPYMSPEQCAADPHDLDTRSDVYSLGVVLYELLCGQLPYELSKASVGRATQIIRELPPTPLSSGDRSLRGDIETIAHKALEKDRDRRYRSSMELADDLRRYLHNEPIVARPASVLYQLRKLTQRNKALVASVAILFIGLVAAVAGLSCGIVQSQRRTSEVREVAHDAVIDIHESLKTVEGATRAREELLRFALDHLEGLERDAGDDPELRSDIADIHVLVGEVIGGNRSSHSDRFDDAHEHFLAAFDIRTALAREEPDDHRRRLDVGRSHVKLGDVYRQKKDPERALAEFDAAMEIADALRLRFPGDPDVMRLAGTATKSVGDMHVKLKDLDAALDAYGRANEIFKERAASLPGDAQAQRDWTTSLIASGYALDRQGLTERALELFRVAEEIRLDARDRAPNARTRRDLLNARYRIGWAHYKLDEPERALAVFEDLLVEARALRAADPDDRRADDDLEKVLAGLADFAEASGSDHRAVEALLEQRALLEEVVEANPTDLDTHKAIQRLDERIAALEADEVP